ncbi:cupin domain-containing protein [Conexibacter woesei]|uniref:cupin domain-containing protein n=1 Tax=Conexibacter woesei TaxID=191495 RepID=UPI000406FAC5|nr:cupin domain-containing protein [Conexibacter woesei]
MANVGDVYNLGGHERLTVTRLDPELLEVRAEWDPTETPQQPLAHRHPSQDEHFVIEEGELQAVVDGAEIVLRAGDTLDVPAGTVHAMWSTAPGVTRAVWQVRPALRTAEMWTEVTALSADAGRMPTPDEGQALLAKYAPEFELVL